MLIPVETMKHCNIIVVNLLVLVYAPENRFDCLWLIITNIGKKDETFFSKT